MNEFCKILEKGMKKQNLSCDKLAKMSTVSAMSISYYRSGKISPPIDKVDKILKALNVTMTLGERRINK